MYRAVCVCLCVGQCVRFVSKTMWVMSENVCRELCGVFVCVYACVSISLLSFYAALYRICPTCSLHIGGTA